MLKKVFFWLARARNIFLWSVVVMSPVVLDMNTYKNPKVFLAIASYIVAIVVLGLLLYRWNFFKQLKKRNLTFDYILGLPTKEKRHVLIDILLNRKPG